MKKIFLIATILFTFSYGKAQSTFSNETDVMKFMQDKTFYNSDLGVEIEYGYMSEINTYAIKLKGVKSGSVIYYINCDIKTYGSFANITGMSVTDGSNFSFRLFKTKLVVGFGEEKQTTFYLKDKLK
jgi:hypothetical protein